MSFGSAEAEANARTKGCVESVYTKTLLERVTDETRKLELWTDSSSERAISLTTKWTQKTIETLEVQNNVGSCQKQNMLEKHKIREDENEEDVLTKHVPLAALHWVLVS